MLASAATQEEKLHYLFALRLVKPGWNIDERRAYFDWLGQGRKEFSRGEPLPTTLNISSEAEASLTPAGALPWLMNWPR